MLSGVGSQLRRRRRAGRTWNTVEDLTTRDAGTVREMDRAPFRVKKKRVVESWSSTVYIQHMVEFVGVATAGKFGYHYHCTSTTVKG